MTIMVDVVLFVIVLVAALIFVPLWVRRNVWRR